MTAGCRSEVPLDGLRVVGKSDLSERFIVIECRDASARRRFSKLLIAATDLLALAKQYAAECLECAGTGRAPMLNAAGFPAGDVECEACADIRAVIAKATGAA